MAIAYQQHHARETLPWHVTSHAAAAAAAAACSGAAVTGVTKAHHRYD